MKDTIDERDFMEACRHSIIKWWNVRMVEPENSVKKRIEESKKEEEIGSFFQMSKEEQDRVKEIMSRLEAEAEHDEQEKQHEIEQVKRQMEENFNSTTNSMSGDYGKKPVEDEEELARIQAILGEKDSFVQQTIQNAANNN